MFTLPIHEHMNALWYAPLRRHTEQCIHPLTSLNPDKAEPGDRLGQDTVFCVVLLLVSR